MSTTDTTGISEIISDNRKRGRPPVLSRDDEKRLTGCRNMRTGNSLSRRQILNRFYAHRAIGVLMPHSPLGWIMPSEHQVNTGTPLHFGVLAELGRIRGDVEMAYLAREILKLGLKPAHATRTLKVRRKAIRTGATE